MTTMAGTPKRKTKVQPDEVTTESSASSLYDEQQKATTPGQQVTEPTPTPDGHPWIRTLWTQKEVIVVMGVLLIITFVCALIPVLRLPTCVVQTLLIGFASIKWEEDSYLATAPRRVLRIILQFFLTLIPFLIGGTLIFLCVEEYRPKPSDPPIPPEQLSDLLPL